MKKICERNSGNSVITGYDKARFNEHDSQYLGKILSYLNLMNLAIMKFIYLLIGITGLTGTGIIIFKVVRLASISNFDMILIFVIGCLSLAVMHAGFRGFFEIKRESKYLI